MALLVGAFLALTVGLLATAIGLDCDRAFYPTVTIVIASYYARFAVMGASICRRARVVGFVGPDIVWAYERSSLARHFFVDCKQ